MDVHVNIVTVKIIKVHIEWDIIFSTHVVNIDFISLVIQSLLEKRVFRCTEFFEPILIFHYVYFIIKYIVFESVIIIYIKLKEYLDNMVILILQCNMYIVYTYVILYPQ